MLLSKFVPSSPPQPQCPQAHSLCLHLYSCHANRFISTIFLDSIHMLGIYPEKTITQKDSCTRMFTAALFTIARAWKQPRCPLTDEWIKKMWYIYTIEYYSAIKRNEIESVEVRWMNLEPVIQSEISQKETKTSYINAYIWNLMGSLANYLLCLLASFKTRH